MTANQLEVVVFWLKKREATFTDACKTGNFVRYPDRTEAVQAAQDTFNLLLREAEREHKLAIEYGGYLADSLPAILISNQ